MPDSTKKNLLNVNGHKLRIRPVNTVLFFSSSSAIQWNMGNTEKLECTKTDICQSQRRTKELRIYVRGSFNIRPWNICCWYWQRLLREQQFLCFRLAQSQDGPPRTISAPCVSGDVRGGDLGRWMALKWETFRFLLSSCTHPNSTAEASRLSPIHPCPFLKAQAQLQ